MSDFFIPLVFGVLVFVNILTAFGVYSAIRNKDYVLIVTVIPLFLVCLIVLTIMITPVIDDSILIQVDATIIAGLLVLLSISLIWRSKSEKPLRPIITKIMGTEVYLTPNHIFLLVIPFGASAIFALINPGTVYEIRLFSMGLAVIGFIILMFFAGLVAFGERKEDLELDKK